MRYHGKLVNGKEDSESGKIYHDNGKLKYRGNLVNGKKHGKGELFHPNSTILYKGRFVGNFIGFKIYFR